MSHKHPSFIEDEQQIIRCPVCGQEYLPAEIFFAEDLLGKPTNIVKKHNGKIDFYFGEIPSYVEEYCCDNCSTTFKVKAKLNFIVEVDEDKDFSHDYVSKLREDPLKLEEIDIFKNENTTEEE